MHPQPTDAEVRRVAQAIRQYLQEHPLAADTAAGIQRWWLLPAQGELPLETVEAALAQLEGSGEVCRVERPWGTAAWARVAAAGTGAAGAAG